MNDHALVPPIDRKVAEASAAAWRSAFLDQFSRAEIAIGKALVKLAGFDISGREKNPHLLGQKLEALDQVLGQLEDRYRPAVDSRKSLRIVRSFEQLRGMAAHGVIRTRLRTNEFAMRLHQEVLRRNRIEPLDRWITQSDAENDLQTLSKAVAALGSQLGQLHRAMESARGGPCPIRYGSASPSPPSPLP